MKINLDFETYSDVDLRSSGLQRYARSPSTRVILATIRLESGAILTYDERDPDPSGMASGLCLPGLLAYLSAANEIHCWNAPFEYAICTHVLRLDIPLERFHCSMAHAMYRTLPGKLDAASKILGLPGKTDQSRRLITLFCTPAGKAKKEGPTDWADFREYNRQDVALERAVKSLLDERELQWPRTERGIWLTNEHINLRGVPVDIERAERALWGFGELCKAANRRIAEITGVANPNSPTQLKAWCKAQGLPVASLAKEELPRILAREDVPPEVREVLNLRSGAAMTAPKKFEVALRQHWEGRMYGMVQYSGAGRTHRFAGRGLQPHNMRQGPKSDDYITSAWTVLAQCHAAQSMDAWREAYKAPFSALADLIRSMIRDPAGQPLIVADYASIEVVVLWWVAGADRLLDTFRAGLDPYKVFAAEHMFGVPYADVTPEQRTLAKPPVLGGGYGLGADTMVEYARNMRVKMSREETGRAVAAYREGHPEVCNAWRGLEIAVHRTLETGKPHKFGHVSFSKRGEHIICRLPSGAEIVYWGMHSVPAFWPDGNPKVRGQLQYWGISQFTRQWELIQTWGGKLIENIVQSIARDILAHGLRRAEAAGLPVVLHVHDEIVTQVLNGDVECAKALLAESMDAPTWAVNCPVQVHPFSCTSYRKE